MTLHFPIKFEKVSFKFDAQFIKRKLEKSLFIKVINEV